MTTKPVGQNATSAPYYSKATAAAATFIVAAVVQFVATHTNFQISQEGVTLATGLVATLLVAAVSNFKPLLRR